MDFIKTALTDVYIIKPSIFKDERGSFTEVFNKREMEKYLSKEINFVQENQSTSKKNVFRGLHYQLNPFAQDKLVRVLSGKIIDIVVDLRKSSPTFKKWIKISLHSSSSELLWVPKGFAHGFHSLEDDTTISYHVTNFYSKEHENTILYNDQELAINWEGNFILSHKDLDGYKLSESILFD